MKFPYKTCDNKKLNKLFAKANLKFLQRGALAPYPKIEGFMSVADIYPFITHPDFLQALFSCRLEPNGERDEDGNAFTEPLHLQYRKQIMKAVNPFEKVCELADI